MTEQELGPKVATRIGIAVTHAGEVVMRFGDPTMWISMDPANAREMAASRIARADEAEEKQRG